jgi:hypothetical protein
MVYRPDWQEGRLVGAYGKGLRLGRLHQAEELYPLRVHRIRRRGPMTGRAKTVAVRVPDDLWASVRRWAPVLNMKPPEALRAAWNAYEAEHQSHPENPLHESGS